MWILTITMIVGGILIFVFGECKKISKESQASLSYAVWGITIMVFVIVLLNHSDFITDKVEAYQEELDQNNIILLHRDDYREL